MPGLPGLPGFGIPRVNYYNQLRVQIGPISYARGYYGPVGYWMYNKTRQYVYAASYAPYFSSNYSGYMSGGAGNPGNPANPVNPALDAIQKNFARAQHVAAMQSNPAAARNAIYDQWAYEKLGVTGLPSLRMGEEPPAGLVRALNAAREADVASGEALNHVVVAIVAADHKNGKTDSAYLPPNLLDAVRFTGSPSADAVNLLREAGKLNIPAAFDAGPLAEIRPALDQEFAAVAAPVLAGKPADQTKVAKLEATAKKARELLEPLTRKLDFEDATAARRFLNHLDAAVTALKGTGTAGLIDPRWGTEGTNVADLVKYMTKNKLLFGPVEKANEDAYLALHQGLVAYLYSLQDQHKPAPKK